MVHAAMAELKPGEVLVLTMPEPRPVALVGELLATQAKAHGAAAILVDASVRDVEELASSGCRSGPGGSAYAVPARIVAGAIGEPVNVGGATIRQGDIVVLDADGVAVVEHERVEDISRRSRERAEREPVKRGRARGGRAVVRARRPARAAREDGQVMP